MSDYGTPTREESAWGIEVDDLGSVDVYDSEADAVTDARKYGAPLVHIVYEYFELPPEEDQ